MSRAKPYLLWAMGAFYVIAGVNHFVNPEFYLQIMPPYLPWHEELVYLSGFAEYLLGVFVVIPQTRRIAAWGIILLLLAIFPANLHVAAHNLAVGAREEGLGLLNWVRLPLQGVLILWAWWYTLPDRASAS